jgi:hypothetical protein
MFSTRRALPLLTLDAATLAAASSLQRRVSTQARAHLCEPPLLSTRAQASPLFATLTASLQLIENPSALSPAFATLTRCLALTPLFAALTKNRGGTPSRRAFCTHIPNLSLFFHSWSHPATYKHPQPHSFLMFTHTFRHHGVGWARTRKKVRKPPLHPSSLLPGSSHYSLLTVHYSLASATLIPRSAPLNPRERHYSVTKTHD